MVFESERHQWNQNRNHPIHCECSKEPEKQRNSGGKGAGSVVFGMTGSMASRTVFEIQCDYWLFYENSSNLPSGRFCRNLGIIQVLVYIKLYLAQDLDVVQSFAGKLQKHQNLNHKVSQQLLARLASQANTLRRSWPKKFNLLVKQLKRPEEIVPWHRENNT